MKIVKKISLMFVIILFSLTFFACGNQKKPVIPDDNIQGNDKVNPPEVKPPVVEPPIVEPPVVEPPVVEPPIVEPPIVEPPVVNPPVVVPPVVNPPVDVKPVLDTTPSVRVPVATGALIKVTDQVTIDYSNTGQGYIMVNYTGSNPQVRLLLTGADSVTYTYILHGGYEVFPLTGKSGTYTIGVYENISGNSYLPVCDLSFDVQLESGVIPYLYPNQYVNYNANSETVRMGASVSKGAHTKLEVIEKVYNYIMKQLTYDDNKAANVKVGYIPNVDEILASKKGICFDYAAMMATMLRTQKIPTMLQIGYAGKVYHAWISVYTEETGWINGIIQFDGKEWKRMDPTFADGSNQSKDIMSYISNSGNYNLMYKH